ncbi:MAG: hypothetical protein HQM14_12040 [SAR324 cluster bacterium]|nr:hypothetical protein [SAR324 cluster bacterium]
MRKIQAMLSNGLWIVSFFMIFSSSAGAHEDGLRGPAFSDPKKIHEMPTEWQKRPVQHDSSVGKVDLSIDINQQLYPFLEPLVQQYAHEKNIKINIRESTCGRSAGKLFRKELDMGAFCCPTGDTDRLPGLRFHTLGIIPIALLVHPDVALNDISLAQARDVFQGNISRWSELGGKNIRIKPIASLHCKKRPGHWRLLLKDEELFTSKFMDVGGMPDQIALLSSTRGAIGYETLNTANRFKHKGIVKFLTIEGFSPEDTSFLLSAKYPIYRVYNITTWEGENLRNPYAEGLVNYLLQHVENLADKYTVIPPSKLKQAGWKFDGNELIGEPM